MRGFSNVSRAGNYGTIPAEEFGAKANEETVLIVMLETVKAFENAEGIAQVSGVDLVPQYSDGDWELDPGKIPGGSLDDLAVH